jgi:hypothetical protein
MEALKNLKLIQAARDEAQRLVADGFVRRAPALMARAAQLSDSLHTE